MTVLISKLSRATAMATLEGGLKDVDLGDGGAGGGRGSGGETESAGAGAGGGGGRKPVAAMVRRFSEAAQCLERAHAAAEMPFFGFGGGLLSREAQRLYNWKPVLGKELLGICIDRGFGF